MGENKSNYVNVLVDEKTADMLNGIFNIAFMFEENKVAEMYKELEVNDEAVKFFTNWSDITHKMGWCKDPNCQRKDEDNK